MKWYSIAILLGVALGFFIALLTGEKATTLTGRLGGDFPAFYAAGRLAASGEIGKIYNLDRLAEEEKDYLPGETGVLPFPYPPHVAVVYATLAFFSFRTAYVMQSIVMSGALVAAVFIIARACREPKPDVYLLLALSFLYFPLMRSIFGGQNTAISVLLITAIWFCILRDRETLAGILLGVLLFKPQFALPLIGLIALSRRWKTAVTAALTGLSIFTASYAFAGQALVRWIEFAPWFSRIDARVNQVNAISYLGFFQALLGSTSLAASILGWTLVAVSVLLISAVWHAGGKTINFNVLMAVTCPALVLIPPHVMYYDISLCMLVGILILGHLSYAVELIGLLWLVGWSQLCAPYLGFSPLFFSALGLFITCFCVLVRELGKPLAPATPDKCGRP